MVLLCENEFGNQPEYNKHFMQFPNFTLSDFQKWAIKGIVENHHILITAHTGSGKTLPAEFAIKYYVEKQKKIIYTTPIKALSNTKLSELRRKYPDISFGIITGDICDNPEADVIIMTTEILRNTLFNKKILQSFSSSSEEKQPNIPLSFEMDIETELGAVIFDEVHYINDEDRGPVWEQAILLLPPHIQLVMLSATIDKPEVFAQWIENQKNLQLKNSDENSVECSNDTKKMVYLIPTNHRVVPLTHYMWITTHENTMKRVKGQPIYENISGVRNKPIVVKSPNGEFNEVNFNKVKKISDYLEKNKHFIKRKFILNDLSTYMKANNHLPAICFVFSRKNVETCAKEITNSLFDAESTIPNTIEDDCKKILISKLPNYKEYIHLPEYTNLIELLKKGVAIHHAGMLSVLREMVELLFDRGNIKLLFATETFAVGINVPAKSTIFTSLEKYNGYTMRNLYPHEYTQMAGRAGRRGIDTQGLVWILGNMVHLNAANEFKQILTGSPPILSSKFKISLQLALHIISAGGNINNISQFTNTSLMKTDIDNELKYYENDLIKLKEDLVMKKNMISQVTKTPYDTLVQYAEKKELLKLSSNKQRKRVLRDISTLEDDNRFIKDDIEHLLAIKNIEESIQKNDTDKDYTLSYVDNNANNVAQFLAEQGFVDTQYEITEKGKIASQIQEAHPLALAHVILESNYFEHFSPSQIASLLSCFTNINVNDEVKIFNTSSTCLQDPVPCYTDKLDNILKQYYDSEYKIIQQDIGTDYTFHRDLQENIFKWCNATNEVECKEIIQNMKVTQNISLGDFVKAILKINNIVQEIEKICEMTSNVCALEKMQGISALLLKYVASNISLYL